MRVPLRAKSLEETLAGGRTLGKDGCIQASAPAQNSATAGVQHQSCHGFVRPLPCLARSRGVPIQLLIEDIRCVQRF